MSAVNLAFLSRRAASRTRSSALARACSALRPLRVLLARVPLASAPSLHGLRSGRAALFGRFFGTTDRSDFSATVHRRLRPFGLPGALRGATRGGSGDLPVPAQRVSVHAWGLRPRRVGAGTRAGAPARLAFRSGRRRRHPGLSHFAAPYPACTSPCQRFAASLTGCRRMTRGHRGSLRLRCTALSSATPCRLSGAFRPPGSPWAAPSGPARRTRLHEWSPNDLLTSSDVAVVTETLYLALFSRLHHDRRRAARVTGCATSTFPSQLAVHCGRPSSGLGG